MDVSIEYLAGLFDGEGCVFIARTKEMGRRGRYYRLSMRCKITMRDNALLELVRVFFETGRIYQKKGRKERHYLPCYDWVVTGAENVRSVLTQLSPYLIAKKAQCRVAMRFLSTMNNNRDGSKRLTEQQHLTREECREELRRLKDEPFCMGSF